MSDITEDWPKRGDLVRYSGGPTALVRCLDPHAGGWHGNHCMGGSTFFSDAPSYGFYPLKPSLEDYKTWFDSEKWRR